MLEIRLHGALAKQFGQRWDLNVTSPREAVAAIEANSPGFRRAIMGLSGLGYSFRVRTLAHDYGDDDIDLRVGGAKRLDIIPVVTGSSAGARLVIGAALIAAAVFTGGTSLAAFSMLEMVAFNAGVGLVLGSVIQMLTPVSKQNNNSGNRLNSWTFNGPGNDLGQGQPVPVIYGEVLTGGYAISGGLSSSDLSVSGSIDASATIGGQFDVSHETINSGTSTTVLSYHAGPFNLTEPYTYAWTVGAFTGASAVRVTGAGTAALRVEVDVTVGSSAGVAINATSSVTLSMTGKNQDGVTVTVSKTEAVKLAVIYKPPEISQGA